jgi:hypothetical protein
MNKKQILASLNKIANELDNTGLHVEANSVTKVMTRLSQYNPKPFPDDFGGFENFETDPDEEFDELENNEEEEDVAVIETTKEDKVIVCYPGPLGKRHVIEWNVKALSLPGQEIIIDWDRMTVEKILPTSDAKRRLNMELINTRIN